RPNAERCERILERILRIAATLDYLVASPAGISAEVSRHGERAGEVCKPPQHYAIDLQPVAECMLATDVAAVILRLEVVLVRLLWRKAVGTLLELTDPDEDGNSVRS